MAPLSGHRDASRRGTLGTLRGLMGIGTPTRRSIAARNGEAVRRLVDILGLDGVEAVEDIESGLDGLELHAGEPVELTLVEWALRFSPREVPSLDGERSLDPRRVWTRTSDGIYAGYQPDLQGVESFYIAEVPCPELTRVRVRDDGAPTRARGVIRLVRGNPRSVAAPATTAKRPAPRSWWEGDEETFTATLSTGWVLMRALATRYEDGNRSTIDIDLADSLPRELWVDWLMEALRTDEGETITNLRVELKRAKTVQLAAAYHHRRGPIEVSLWLERGGGRQRVGWFPSHEVLTKWESTVAKATKRRRDHLAWLVSTGGAVR